MVLEANGTGDCGNNCSLQVTVRPLTVEGNKEAVYMEDWQRMNKYIPGLPLPRVVQCLGAIFEKLSRASVTT